MGRGVRFPAEGVSRRSARGDSTHGQWREDRRPHVRSREPHRWPATVGGHGLGQGRARVARALLRGDAREERNHGERDQPWMDGEQRLEHAAIPGPGSHPELARARVDAHGAVGNAGRRRQCRGAHLLGAGRLDHGTGDLRGWRRLVDESRGPSRDPAGVERDLLFLRVAQRRMFPPHQRRGSNMATYITLLKYTDQGIKTIKESPSRLEKARQLLKSLGGELKSFHLMQGRFDAIVIAEAPNDEVAAKFALASGSQGNVRTETTRAFTEEE